MTITESKTSDPLIPAFWEIEHRVLQVAAEQFDVGLDELSPASRLLEDLGLDSLALAEFIIALEEEFLLTNRRDATVSHRPGLSVLSIRDGVTIKRYSGSDTRAFANKE